MFGDIGVSLKLFEDALAQHDLESLMLLRFGKVGWWSGEVKGGWVRFGRL